MHQDLRQTIKEDVFQLQFLLHQVLLVLLLLIFAHQVLNQTEKETVLHHQSQLYAQLDTIVMEMETVFQIQLLSLTHAHLDKLVMEQETASLYQFKLHANMDMKQIHKVIAFQFSQLQLHQ